MLPPRSAPVVCVSGKLITGQNPQSSTACANAVITALVGGMENIAQATDLQVSFAPDKLGLKYEGNRVVEVMMFWFDIAVACKNKNICQR